LLPARFIGASCARMMLADVWRVNAPNFGQSLANVPAYLVTLWAHAECVGFA
jgi:hypothetical protein